LGYSFKSWQKWVKRVFANGLSKRTCAIQKQTIRQCITLNPKTECIQELKTFRNFGRLKILSTTNSCEGYF
jgi:hypothetical protein